MDFRGQLFNIMPIDNVRSVNEYGILSNEKVRTAIPNSMSVAMRIVQERRDKVKVPNGLWLHQYANLYFDPRNPMLYKIKMEKNIKSICILIVDKEVLSLNGVVLSDCNASSDYVRFLEPSQIAEIDFEKVYAMDWRHSGDSSAYYNHRSTKCAEVLVPERIDSKYILGAHVVDITVKNELIAREFMKEIFVSPNLFFC